MSRKKIKYSVEEELEDLGIVFSKPKRVNEPQRISLKVTENFRMAVLKCEKWTFTGSFDDVNVEKVGIFFK